MQQIVFAGGTHGGKTTLVEYFAKEGYDVVPEAGIQIINELNVELGVDGQKEWRKNNQALFYERIAKRQIELETATPEDAELIFFDRSMIDLIGFCRYVNIEVPQIIIDHARQSAFQKVFICETLESFNNRTDTGRGFSKEDAEQITEHVRYAYEEFGYTPEMLPDMPIEDRVKQIRKSLDL